MSNTTSCDFHERSSRPLDAEAGFFRGDSEAKATFDTLLDLIKRPSARAAVQAKAKPAVETKAAAPNLASLLMGDLSAEMFCRPGKLPVRCVQVIDETHDVKTFRFVADPPKLFRYHPGQFVTLEVPVDGKIVRRSYTISATPSRPHAISVTVKRVERVRSRTGCTTISMSAARSSSAARTGPSPASLTIPVPTSSFRAAAALPPSWRCRVGFATRRPTPTSSSSISPGRRTI